MSLTGLPWSRFDARVLTRLTASRYGERSVDIMENPDLFIKVSGRAVDLGERASEGEELHREEQGMYYMREE